MAKKSKQPPKPLTLWEGWPKPPENPPPYTGPPIPVRRVNHWEYIVPLIILAGLIATSVWFYGEYLAPQQAAQESAYSKTLATAEKYEGEVIQKKSQEPNCFSLTFDRKETIHSLCVSEELWNEQTEGKPFDVSLLREEKEDEPLKLPW